MLLFFLIGCGESEPPKPWKYSKGDVVTIKLTDRPGMIVNRQDIFGDRSYSVRYEDDEGELRESHFQEFELVERNEATTVEE